MSDWRAQPMHRFSVCRLLLAEAAFAGVLLFLLNLCEEGENIWPALVSALAVGGTTLFGKEGDWWPALGVAVAFFVGMIVGFWLLAPRYLCRLGPEIPGENLFFEIPVGFLFAFGFSLLIHRNDRP